MVVWIAKKFIRNAENVSDKDVRGSYGILCSVMGILFNLLLFIGKYVAGVLSGSIAIVADAMNSMSDAGSSIITLIGFRFAGKKPDPDHPFGHGRVEYISGLIVSFLVLLMGFELGKSSIEKILHPEEIQGGWLIISILIISILIKCYMAAYNHRIGKMINSAAMKATATDSLSDAVSTTVVLGCTIASKFTSFNLDGWCGLVVSVLVLYAGYGAVKETMDPLLGQPPEEEFVKEIKNLVMSHEGIVGIHDMIVHDYGPGRVMISLHAEVPGNGDIYELHDMIDIVEREIKSELGCEATIHMDPIAVGDERTDAYKKMVLQVIKDIDEVLSIHDFRIVPGTTHTNLVFDVLAPAGYSTEDKELIEKIQEKIQGRDNALFAVIKIDHAYVER